VVQRSERARRVLDLAREQAEGLGHRYLGPEHLVLGVLRDGGSGASRVLETHGVDLAARAGGAGAADRDDGPLGASSAGDAPVTLPRKVLVRLVATAAAPGTRAR
jgi:ATP-dependent Clp protease ATP-binding subunit ClpC